MSKEIEQASRILFNSIVLEGSLESAVIALELTPIDEIFEESIKAARETITEMSTARGPVRVSDFANVSLGLQFITSMAYSWAVGYYVKEVEVKIKIVDTEREIYEKRSEVPKQTKSS